MYIIEAGSTKAGYYITIPGVLQDRPVLVEHVRVSDNRSLGAIAHVTIWPTSPLANRDERTLMVTLSIDVTYPLIVFSEVDQQKIRTGRWVIGQVESVREGSTSDQGSVSRWVRFTDRREFRTSTNSSSTYDAANLHGGDYALLELSAYQTNGSARIDRIQALRLV